MKKELTCAGRLLHELGAILAFSFAGSRRSGARPGWVPLLPSLLLLLSWRRYEQDPESWRAARDAGDLRPTRLDGERSGAPAAAP